MKHTRKISIALVIAMVLMLAIAVIPASAASQPETLYLTPNANWKQDNARFAAYFFGNGETWVSMTDANGDGVYEVTVPTAKVYPNVIFCRMNPGAAANNWNNKWNQTADLTIPTSGANHFTVKEGTWDSGGGTWSTYGSTCLHTNLGPAATCTTAQLCNDCGDPVVSALGHTFNSANLCTRCNEQATFTVAGSGAHLGTEWDTGNTANDMTYADGVYTKVYTNVAAGSYELKVVRDHAWGTAYPSANKAYKVETTGSTVTVTLKGTTVDIVVEAPQDPNACVHEYTYECDKICNKCLEITNPDATHTVVHVDAKAATCTENGNVEYWYCSDCGSAWLDEAQTQVTNLMSVKTPAAHSYFYPCDPVCQVCYEITNPDAAHDIKHVEAKAATCTEYGNVEYWYCSYCGATWTDEALTQVTNQMSVKTPATPHSYTTYVGAVTIENVTYAQFECADCDATENKAVFTFKGGSIRYAEADGTACPTDAVDIRFGYTINPDVLAWVEENGATIAWGWNYQLIADDNTITGIEEGYYKLEDGTTNVVFTNVPQKRLGNVIAVQMYVTINGNTLTENYQERTTETVLNATLGDANAAAAAYAQKVLDAYAEIKPVTVYFQNNWMWSDVRCHYWGGEGVVATEWPGAPMTLVRNDGNYDVYSIELPKGVTGIVFTGIKDDGSGLDQSPDIIDFVDGNCYYMLWDNGNTVGSADISVILPEN